MKFCCECKKHVNKQSTHAIAKTNILWAQNNNNNISILIGPRTSNNDGPMELDITGAVPLGRAKNLHFLEVRISGASREGKQGCGEPHALAHCDKA